MKKFLIFVALLLLQSNCIHAKILDKRFIPVFTGICIKQAKQPETDKTKIKINVDSHKAGSITFTNNSIEKIKVSPLFQNNGYGSLLLSHALQQIETQNGNEIITKVESSNLPALKLFEKFGFQLHRVEIDDTQEVYILSIYIGSTCSK